MSETWYAAHRPGFAKVEPVSVERSTDSSVWIEGGRRAIEGVYESFFKTEDEAWGWIEKDDRRKLKKLQGQMLRENTRLEDIRKARREASK